MNTARSIGVVMAMLAALALPAAASAAQTDIKLKPVAGRFGDAPDFKPLGNGTAAQAQWTNKRALDGKFSVLLEKSVPTTSAAFAAALVKHVKGLTVAELGDIGFSVNGPCTGGSPRFNLFYDGDFDGNADGVAFYGCGNHVTGSPAPGWTSMSANASVPDAISPFNLVPFSPLAQVTSLSVLVDEQGTYHIDRVVAAGQTTGEPNGN